MLQTLQHRLIQFAIARKKIQTNWWIILTVKSKIVPGQCLSSNYFSIQYIWNNNFSIQNNMYLPQVGMRPWSGWVPRGHWRGRPGRFQTWPVRAPGACQARADRVSPGGTEARASLGDLTPAKPSESQSRSPWLWQWCLALATRRLSQSEILT